MNEQLQTALAELITSTLQAKEFIVGELPEVVRQLLLWHGIQDFILFCIGLVLLVVYGYCLHRFVIKNWDKIKEVDNDEGFFIAVCMCICAVVFTIPLMFIFPLTWLQIWIVPKVWLIEYAASLVK